MVKSVLRMSYQEFTPSAPIILMIGLSRRSGQVSKFTEFLREVVDSYSIKTTAGSGGFKTAGSHDAQGIATGFRPGVYRPTFGSVISRMRPSHGFGLPHPSSLIPLHH